MHTIHLATIHFAAIYAKIIEMSFVCKLVSVLSTLAVFSAESEPLTLKSIEKVCDYTLDGTGAFARVYLSGTILCTDEMIFQDATGRAPLHEIPSPEALRPGDVVNIYGYAWPSSLGEPFITVQTLTVQRHGTPPKPMEIPLDKLDEREHNYLPIVTEGAVIRVIPDGIDARYQILLLKHNECLMPVAVEQGHETFSPDDWQDAIISVTGVFYRSTSGSRRFSGPIVLANKGTGGLSIVTPPPQDPFDAPTLKDFRSGSPKEIARLGRQRVQGEVLATWGENFMMLREQGGRIVNVELDNRQTLPACGVSGIAVGYAETDLLHINLSHARFKPLANHAATSNETPQDVEAPQLFSQNDSPAVMDKFYGKLLRLRGIVRTSSSAAAGDGFFTIESQDRRLSVDIRSHRDIAERIGLGYEIEITARCRFETDNWRPDNIFLQISGIVLVPRDAYDIRVLSKPSWWTPARLLLVIGALFLALAAFFVWNRILQRLVERKSRELMKSNLKTVRSELRIGERTRLAVELHDSVSQNISGASMRVEAARKMMPANPAKALDCLAVAAKTLSSCREELRNCIWDLRSRALEEPDMNAAIRKTIEPLLAKARLSIRFNVPRQKLSENCAHAVLCIVRELVANAIRHGQAACVAIAGTIDRELLRFSVTDDGCGFDPSKRPGIADGHFGLQGIEERCRHFGGGTTIDSDTESGTRVEVWIKLES